MLQEESQEDTRKFIGIWQVESGWLEDHDPENISEEIWKFYGNNDTLKIIVTYDNDQGIFSTWGDWKAKNGRLHFFYGTFDYSFSDNLNHLTLSKGKETVILNKIE